jgi:biotin synthase
MKWETLEFNDIPAILSSRDDDLYRGLLDYAYDVKRRTVGTTVYFRGLIEYSNICVKNCYYCGIRRDNRSAHRYTMTPAEVIDAGLLAYRQGMGSIVLQAGERTDPAYIDTITGLIGGLKSASGGKLGITLSLGEQSPGVYRRWFDAGAHRYLLRIETSSPALYARLHPADHDYARRVECLRVLKGIGYQVGTGVMIGLPYQTVDDLAGDIEFFRDMDIDMIGMGPYILHNDTPLANGFDDTPASGLERFRLALKMVALTRILLKDVNIAATTALQVLDPAGREKALRAGANIVMPNITPAVYRPDYTLYQGKPCADEEPDQCMGCLSTRIRMTGEEVGLNEWGDSPHFRGKASAATATSVPVRNDT